MKNYKITIVFALIGAVLGYIAIGVVRFFIKDSLNAFVVQLFCTPVFIIVGIIAANYIRRKIYQSAALPQSIPKSIPIKDTVINLFITFGFALIGIILGVMADFLILYLFSNGLAEDIGDLILFLVLLPLLVSTGLIFGIFVSRKFKK